MAACGRKIRGLCPRVEAHEAANGGWTSGFFSREAEEHVYMVGFVKQRLDLHGSEKGGIDCLSCGS